MKQLFRFSIVLSVLFIFSACTTPGPNQVAENFLIHFFNGEYDKAKKYATPETKELLLYMQNEKDNLPAEEKAQLEALKSVEVSDFVCEMGDNKKTATCSFVVQDTKSGDQQDGEVDLRKVDGKWKVHLTK